MVCINDYENAKAKYFSTLSVKTTSLVSMSFHKEFLGNIIKSFDDYNRLNFILSRNVSEMDDPKLPAFIFIAPPTVPGIQYNLSSPPNPLIALSFINFFREDPPETFTTTASSEVFSYCNRRILVILITAPLNPLSLTIIFVPFPTKRYFIFSSF